MQPISLIILRNELRLMDNPLLYYASESKHPVWVVCCLPLWDELHDLSKTPRIGIFRRKFYLECFYEFKNQFQERGIPLSYLQIPKIQNPSQVKQILMPLVESLPNLYTITKVFISDDPGYYEKNFEKGIYDYFTSLGAQIISYDCNGIVEVNSIHKLPMIFTQFKNLVESNAIGFKQNSFHSGKPLKCFHDYTINCIDYCYEDKNANLEIPTPSKDPRCTIEFVGGESKGFNRMNEYVWKEKTILTYKETRNGMIRPNDSSKLSPWLASGALSPRVVIHEINQFENHVHKNESTYWLKYELLWREYFRWILRKFGKKVFFLGGIQGKKYVPKETSQMEKWKQGETGQDFVDANMKELLLTGFMSNRGRQNVASYLVHYLKQDWRWGAEWFETQLIDYDVSNNWGNWNYIAGVGNDPRNRIFNVEKQAKDYDPYGEYRNIWLGGKFNG